MLPPPVVKIRVAEFFRNRQVRVAPVAERELLVVGIVITDVAGVVPIVPRVVDDHVQDDAKGKRLPVLRVGVGSLDEVNQVLLGAETRVHIQVVVNVIAMVSVSPEDRTQPNRGAADRLCSRDFGSPP